MLSDQLLSSVPIQCPQSELDAETVKSILAEYKIHNADVTLRSDATADDLIDVVEGNRYWLNGAWVWIWSLVMETALDCEPGRQQF